MAETRLTNPQRPAPIPENQSGRWGCPPDGHARLEGSPTGQVGCRHRPRWLSLISVLLFAIMTGRFIRIGYCWFLLPKGKIVACCYADKVQAEREPPFQVELSLAAFPTLKPHSAAQSLAAEKKIHQLTFRYAQGPVSLC